LLVAFNNLLASCRMILVPRIQKDAKISQYSMDQSPWRCQLWMDTKNDKKCPLNPPCCVESPPA
jgi:hypothetical protein